MADDERLTPFGGLLVTGEIARRLGVVGRIDDEVAGVVRGVPVKQRARGTTPGELVMSLAESQLVGGDCFDDLRVLRVDTAGAKLRAVAHAPAPQTALELASRFNTSHLRGVERALAQAAAALDAQLGRDPEWVTLDVDALPVQVHGKRKQAASFMHDGRYGYQALIGTHAERGRPVAWDLLSGSDGGKGTPCEKLVRRAFALLPTAAHKHVRIDSGFYAVSTLELIANADATFTLSLPRYPVLWTLVDALAADAWADADGMDHAQVAENLYTPGGWTRGALRLVIRRVRLRASEISADKRSRRRRTIPPAQLKLALAGTIDEVYGYSFVLTNLPCAHDRIMVEKLHRQRGQIEERLKDAKLGMAARHMPSGKMPTNQVWLAATMTALTLAAMTCDLHPDCRASLDAQNPDAPLAAALVGQGILTTPPDPDNDKRPTRRHGKALRRMLYCVPARLTRSARRVTMHLPDGLLWADNFRIAYLTAHALAAT